MTKLTQEQIEEIIFLKKNNSAYRIAEQFKVSPMVIYYHTNPELKKRLIEYHKKWFNSLPLEKKRRIRESQREYQRIYHNNLYKNNPEFRKKQIERSKKK